MLNIEPINYSYSRFVVSAGLRSRDMVSVDDQGPGQSKSLIYLDAVRSIFIFSKW